MNATDYFVTITTMNELEVPLSDCQTAELIFDDGLIIEADDAPDPHVNYHLQQLTVLLTQHGRFRITVDYTPTEVVRANIFVDSNSFRDLMETLGTFPGERRLCRLLTFGMHTTRDISRRVAERDLLTVDTAVDNMMEYECQVITGEMFFSEPGYYPVGNSGYGSYTQGPFGNHFSLIQDDSFTEKIQVTGGFLLDSETRTAHERIATMVQLIARTRGQRMASTNPVAPSYWPTSASLVVTRPECMFAWKKYCEQAGLDTQLLITGEERETRSFRQFSNCDVVICNSEVFVHDSGDSSLRKRFYHRRQCMARQSLPRTLENIGVVDFFWQRVILDVYMETGYSVVGNVTWVVGKFLSQDMNRVVMTVTPPEDDVLRATSFELATSEAPLQVVNTLVQIPLTVEQQYMYSVLVGSGASRDALRLFCCGRDRDMLPDMHIVSLEQAFNLGSAHFDEVLDGLRDQENEMPAGELEVVSMEVELESEDDDDGDEDGGEEDGGEDGDEDSEEEDDDFDPSDSDEETDSDDEVVAPELPLRTRILTAESSLQRFTSHVEHLKVSPNECCEICLENQIQVLLSCSHTLCLSCVYKIRDRSNCCPYCRGPMNKENLFYMRDYSQQQVDGAPVPHFNHRYPKIGAILQIVGGVKRTVVFCEFLPICHFVSFQLKACMCATRVVTGPSSVETLEWFNDSRGDPTKVLVVHWVKGMDRALFPPASHIIFYHRMAECEKASAVRTVSVPGGQLQTLSLVAQGTLESAL